MEIKSKEGTPFVHRHAAHCESGVTSSLLTHQGLSISEAMAFGIGSGLMFAHFPFIKVTGISLTTFRTRPGSIFSLCCRRLNVEITRKKYRDPLNAMADLDSLLSGGQPVGLQTNIYWLPYFPDQFRFQFNGHNLIVTEKNDSFYQISDPVLDKIQTCASRDLVKARFSKGAFAAKGLLFYPKRIGKVQEYEAAIRKGIKSTLRMMRSPMRYVGINGMKFLSRRINYWPQKSLSEAKLNLGQVIRMQEEIGTGGAGFRYMWAAFLQEAGTHLEHDFLSRASEQMTAVGDHWREFAVASAKACKYGQSASDFFEASERLLICAEKEKKVYQYLSNHI